MQWKFSGKQEIYIEIAERYKEYISVGILSAGEKLPSVRAAALEMGVNPNTVARAYEKLEKEGFISVIPKKGVYVYDPGNNDKMNKNGDNYTGIKDQLAVLKNRGIEKDVLIKLIEEVYGND